MIKSLIVSCFCLLTFFQCGQNQTSNINNGNSNVVTISTPIPQEFLLGIWKGTEHNTQSPILINFKNNQEIEYLDCAESKEIINLTYKYYQEDNKSVIKMSNEKYPLYPWINDLNELKFDYDDRLRPRSYDGPDDTPIIRRYRFKRAEKMLCDD